MAKNEVAKKDQGPMHFTDDDLLGVNSWEDALTLLNEVGEFVESADEVIGNGFAILPTDQKSRLEGVPLMLLSWRFTNGDQGEFVSVLTLARTQSGIEKWIVNDGSTGICDQLRTYTKSKNKHGGLMVKRGLRRSDYTYTSDDGKEKPATTFYLDTSA